MKVLVAYASRLGSTRSIAYAIAARLRIHGINATASPVADIHDATSFDAVVIGSAVYAGHWMDDASAWVETHVVALSVRPTWLFSSGPVGERASRSEPRPASEVAALQALIGARGHRIFAGALDRSTIADGDFPFIERVVARRFVPEGDFRDWPAIETWADAIAADLAATQQLRPVH